MGFYGNVTNIQKTQFQFDRIYPNRYEMTRKMAGDGIYFGRHVLIEYDDKKHGLKEFYLSSDGKFYTGSNFENLTLVKAGDVKKGELICVPATRIDPVSKKEIKYNYLTGGAVSQFYRCEEVSNDGANFSGVLIEDNDPYVINFNIDKLNFGSGRGYDSTVWEKVYTEGVEKYVMIAELNTVVPTFDISADAPTMSPITPHFDTNSTNVYYKLHMQPQWGLRVKEAASEEVSDVKTTWTSEVYNPSTGISESKTEEKNAAIYYNKAAFEPQVGESEIIKHKQEGNDYVNILPTGSSGNLYNKHDGTAGMESANDIQEIEVNLPSIGNMMSDAWDIIHGPNRDNARTDENSSLQGRLDSFKDMNSNTIPVKRNPDGTFVGTTINGGNQRMVVEQGILEEILSTSFEEDDAWIRTEINTAGRNESDTNIKAISIHHTFHSVEDTTSTIVEENRGDTIELYTPKVDAAGHVVGKNIETVTLPYSFKTIKTNGRVAADTYYNPEAPSISNIDADNTKDELSINSGNKWIKIETDADKDILTISHDIHTTTSTTSELGLSSEEDESITFNIPTYSFDEAGHYSYHDVKTLTMPFGYGKITGDAGSGSAATATFDTLTFGSDEWLTATVEKDSVVYSHDFNPEEDTVSESNLNENGDTINLYTPILDSKGHVVAKNIEIVTLPYGYKTFEDSEAEKGSSSADNTQDTFVFKGDSWIKPIITEDLLTLNHIGPVSSATTAKDNVTPFFGGTFTIEDWYFDEKGHKFEGKTHTVKIPEGSLEDADRSGSDLVTQLSFVSSTGKLSTTRENLSSLKLAGYVKATDNNDIASEDTLAQALSKLQTQIHDEETNRSNAISSESQTREEAISNEAAAREEAINNLNNEITSLKTKDTELDGKIKELQDKDTELSQSIADNVKTLKEVDTEITNINSEIGADDTEGLKLRIKTLENQISSLISRIEALENPTVE